MLSVVVCLSVLFLNTCYGFASTPDYNYIYDDNISTFDQAETTEGQFRISNIFDFGSLSSGKYTQQSNQFSRAFLSNDLNYTGTYSIRDNLEQINPCTKYFREQFVISGTGGLKMATKGSNISFSLNNVKMSLFASDSNGNLKRYSYFNPKNIAQMELHVYDNEGNSYKLKTITKNFKVTANTLDPLLITFGADFENVPCDVYRMNIVIIYYGASGFDNNNGDTTLTSTSWDYAKVQKGYGYDNSTLSLNVDSNVSGLLSSIIGFIKSILDGVVNIFEKITDFALSVANSFAELFTKLGNWFTDLFSKLGNWFSDLFQKLIELPSKIWNVFETGLKKLFVPTSDYIETYKDNWDSLMSDRFGALYEVFGVMLDYINAVISGGDNKDTIIMPEVSIDLENGNKFSFGGYNIDLVPDRLEFLADALKFMFDIIFTLGFVNALKRKYDTIIGENFKI